MTDTINDRLAKLQAKLKVQNRIGKTAYHAKMGKTKKKLCQKCFSKLFSETKKFMLNKKIYCEKCYNLKIKVDTVIEQPNMWEIITPIGE